MDISLNYFTLTSIATYHGAESPCVPSHVSPFQTPRLVIILSITTVKVVVKLGIFKTRP